MNLIKSNYVCNSDDKSNIILKNGFIFKNKIKMMEGKEAIYAIYFAERFECKTRKSISFELKTNRKYFSDIVKI